MQPIIMVKSIGSTHVKDGGFYILDGQHRITAFKRYPQHYEDEFIYVLVITPKHESLSFARLFEILHCDKPQSTHLLGYKAEFPCLM